MGGDDAGDEDCESWKEGIAELGGSGGSGVPLAPATHPLRDMDDPACEALSHMEVLSDASMKRMTRVTYLTVAVGTGLLAALFGMKMTYRFDELEDVGPVVILNAVVAAIDIVILSGVAVKLAVRLRAVRRAGLHWSKRRKRVLGLFLAQLAAVWVSNVMFLAPNAYVLARDCAYFDKAINIFGGLRWAALNALLALFTIQARSYNLWVDDLGHSLGPRDDALYLDAPWYSNWFIFCYWALVQAMDCLLSIRISAEMEVECDKAQTCRPPDRVRDVSAVMAILCLGYFVMFGYFMWRAFTLFAKKSYVQFRWVNIASRLAFRQLGVMLLFGVLSLTFLWFTRPSSCMSYATSWLGFTPMQMTLAVFMSVTGWTMTPMRPGTEKSARVLTGEAHWLEKDSLDHKRTCRKPEKWEYQPLFCFETTVKLVYWCEFIYEYNYETKEAARGFSLDTALSLYGLTDYEYLRGEEMDANAMLAWNQQGTILVCFRGTYSAANIVADLKFWRLPHPPKRGHVWMGTCPLVHRGFLQSWTTKGFDNTILDKVKQIMGSSTFDLENLHIYVTGHSLGGAMAVLASHDIRRKCNIYAHQISCYTFGCPRVGNHSFARDYNSTVPDTWHVINDVDAVPRMPKFWMMFKRAGHRVVLNANGDMIVSPMFLEFMLTSVFGKVKVVHHWLSGYRGALSAVTLSQFHRYKALPGGSEAMKALFDKGDIARVLGVNSNSAKKLQNLASKVWTQPSGQMRHLESVNEDDDDMENAGDASMGKGHCNRSGRGLSSLSSSASRLLTWVSSKAMGLKGSAQRQQEKVGTDVDAAENGTAGE